MTKARSIALFILFLATAAVAQPPGSSGFRGLGQPVITSFFSKQYRAHPANYGVVQDKNGIMYFANLWCVLQFDGTLWRNIYLPKGASCTSLAMDGDSVIYVGGRNAIGYLKTDSIGRKYYASLIDQLPEKEKQFNEIWKIAVGPAGIFFSSYERTFLFDRKTRKLNVIRDAAWYVFTVAGTTYITDDSGIFMYRNDSVVEVPNSSFLKGKFITAMTDFGNDVLIATSEAGIFIFDGVNPVRWSVKNTDLFRSYNITKIQNLHGQYLAIATELNGLFITDLQGNVIHHFNKTNGLATNTVSDFFLDSNNILWITLYNGVAFVPLFNQVTFINEYAGVSGIPYGSAVYNNKLYLATSEGLFSKEINGMFDQKQFTRVSNGLVWSLSVIDNKLFCGQAITAFTVDGDKIETLYNEGTWKFSQIDSNTILMGTYSGLHYLKKRNGKWLYQAKIKGFNEPGRSFAVDKLGDVWVGHDNRGVFKLRLSPGRDSVTQVKSFLPSEELPFANGPSVARLGDEVLFSTNVGVYRYRYQDETIRPHQEINRFLHERNSLRIKKIIPRGKNLWIIDSNGVIVELFVQGSEVSLARITELFRGNLITDFEHLNPANDGSIIGTLDGFALYNPSRDTVKQVPLRAFVSRMESASHVLSDGNYTLNMPDAAIPYRENNLRFTFASTAYQNLNTNQYQFYLEGFDDESTWSSPVFLTFKEYTNLRPGKYKFHLRTINFENRVSGETVVAFEIKPPWYGSVWAYIVYAILLVVAAYVARKRIQGKIQRERKRAAEAEQHQSWLKQKAWEEIDLANKKKMMALEHEKLEIERQALLAREGVLEKEKEQERKMMELEREKLEADLSHKNNELTSLTLHISQKNEMINKIANQLTKTIQEARDEHAVKSLKEIRSSLQKGLDSDHEWERFTSHFDTVHEGFLKKLKQQHPDLSTSTLKLCAFIKMRLSSKQIASLMNTAPESVLKARYRLRAKFNLPKETGLEEFLNNF